MKNTTYTIETQSVFENKQIITGDRCNAISFTNRGTDTVYVNNEPLPENESMSINGLDGEHDKTNYKINWLPGATSKALYIKIKRYNP